MTEPTLLTDHRVLLAPTIDLALGVDADVTVEAEFGASVVLGRVATFAHHVPSAARERSPCANPDADEVMERRSGRRFATILLSHIDLDSIGGALRVMGSPVATSWETQGFWALAGAVDVRGPHRIAEAADAADLGERHRKLLEDRLRAFWAWGRSRPRLPRDVVSDVTGEVREAERILGLLLADVNDSRVQLTPEALGWIKAGREATAAEDTLEAASRRNVVERDGVRVVCREADQFVAALHRIGRDTHVVGTASRDTRSGAVTIALADPVPGVSCAAVARGLWGPDAGGHAGIAGSPRGQVMPDGDLQRAAEALVAAVVAARKEPVEVPPTPERWIPARDGSIEGMRSCSRAVQNTVRAVEVPPWARYLHVDITSQVNPDTFIRGTLRVFGVEARTATGARIERPVGVEIPVVKLPTPPWVFHVGDDPWTSLDALWMLPEEAQAAWAMFTRT